MSMRYLAGFISAFYNPLKVPDAPTIGTATNTYGGSVSIAFTAPANVGGSAITSYVAIAIKTSDGSTVVATGASSPISITGLTNSSAYTVKVAAINSFGPSFYSADSNSVTPLSVPPIGASYGGGYFAGQVNDSGIVYNLIISPKATGENTSVQWKTTDTDTPGTNSVINGPANSAAMNNASHPAAQFCENLTIGGYSDWYLPSKNELATLFYFLKPSTAANNTASGANANAVSPQPISTNYSSGSPSITSAGSFQYPNSECFEIYYYYRTSTQFSAGESWLQLMESGQQFTAAKTSSFRARAIRRVVA